jgi:hypothetical protein
MHARTHILANFALPHPEAVLGIDGDITNSGVSGVVGFYCCRRTCTIISPYHLFLSKLTRRGTSMAILNA